MLCGLDKDHGQAGSTSILFTHCLYLFYYIISGGQKQGQVMVNPLKREG